MWFILLVIRKCFSGFPQPRGIPRLDGKIVGGEEADIHDYPYQVSLRFLGAHMCGGSILNKRFIVTAAHCTEGTEVRDLSVHAGSSNKETGGQVISVANVYRHPDYSTTTHDYDVSVLELKKDLELNENVQPIQLTQSELPAGELAVCTGWGRTSTNGYLPIYLRKVEVHTDSREDCAAAYGGDKITERMICASDPDKDACQVIITDSYPDFIIDNANR